MTVPVGEDTKRRALIESPLVVAACAEGAPALERYARAPPGDGISRSPMFGFRRAGARSIGLEDLALARLDERRRIALRGAKVARRLAQTVATTQLALTLPMLYAPLATSTPLLLFPLPFAMGPAFRSSPLLARGESRRPGSLLAPRRPRRDQRISRRHSGVSMASHAGTFGRQRRAVRPQIRR